MILTFPAFARRYLVDPSAGAPPDRRGLRARGETRNMGERPGRALGLKVSLLGEDGKEVHGWSVAPQGVAIGPGEARAFKTRGETSGATRKVIVTLAPH